jgi:hypothetical protein
MRESSSESMNPGPLFLKEKPLTLFYSYFLTPLSKPLQRWQGEETKRKGNTLYTEDRGLHMQQEGAALASWSFVLHTVIAWRVQTQTVIAANNSRPFMTVTEVIKWIRNFEPRKLMLFRPNSRHRTENSLDEFSNELSMNRRKQHNMLLALTLVLLLSLRNRCSWWTSRWFLLLSPPMMLGDQLRYLDH